MVSTLAVGRFRGSMSKVLAAGCQDANLDLVHVDSIGEALEWGEENSPHSLLVDGSEVDIEKVCFGMRTNPRLALVPILTLTFNPTELVFAETFNSGGDDVVSCRVGAGLGARLRRLPEVAEVRPPASSAKLALVVAGEPARRMVLARVLAGAGYAIQYAADVEEASQVAERGGPHLFVLDTEEDSVRDLVTTWAPQDVDRLWILSTPPRKMRAHISWIQDVPNAAITDSFAPPENIVFLANELGRGHANDNRTSRRLLYGALIGFRCAGREEDDHGLTYNISEGGLYVRSLAPPVEDRVWLELLPPRTDQRVRLEGRVCWRRGFGPSTEATVPPGFGVQISDGAKADWEAWKRGYQAMFESIGT